MKGQKFIPLLVIAAGLLAYQNSFTGSYFHDDFGSIFNNPTIRHLWPIWQPLLPLHGGGWTVPGRPLINLSLAINYAFGRYNVWGYHALNLTVHILAGLTLLGIVRRTLLQPVLRERFGAAANELALATAVLWIVHPLQTESVTYIVQRAESIMGLFYLLTLYCFIRGAESPLVARSPRDEPRPRLWYSLSVVACALGMASKEVMVSAPLMVLLYDRAFLSGSFREAWRRRWPLYLALASTWILLGYVVLSAGNFATASMIAQGRGLTRWQYLATQPGVILHYLRLSVWPHPLRFDSYKWPIAETWMSVLPPTVVVVILVGATAWAWPRNPVWGFVGTWFFLILAPSSSFVPLGSPIFEHRMYLSLAAVVSVVVMGLYRLAGRHSLAVFTVMAIGLGFLTWRQNQFYCRNPHYNMGLALAGMGVFQGAIGEYEQALRITPNDAWLHYNLGAALSRLGKAREAREHFEQALRIQPDYPQAHYNLGLTLWQTGKPQDAIGHWEQALRLKPDYAEAHNNIGSGLAQLGRMNEAVEHWEQALRINPSDAEAHYNLGNALAQVGKVQEAVGHYEHALQIKPDDVEAHYRLGAALEQIGKLQEAIKHYEQAIRIKPDFAEAHYNLGIALMGVGRLPEAVNHLEQALRTKPGYAETRNSLGVAFMNLRRPPEAQTHNSLGVAFMKLGRLPEAVEQWEQALRIEPNSADFHNNLGIALFQMGRLTEAIVHYEQALRIEPNFAEAHYNLGVALEQVGRGQEALVHYEQALRIAPDFAEAQKGLARLRAVQ